MSETNAQLPADAQTDQEVLDSILPSTNEVVIESLLADGLTERPDDQPVSDESPAYVLVVKPMRFGHLPKLTKYITTLLCFRNTEETILDDRKTITEGDAEVANPTFNQQIPNPKFGTFDVKKALLEGGEDIMEILAIAVNRKRAWFDLINLEEGVEILATVITQNQDFFVQTVLPMIRELTGRISRATQSMKVTGQTTS